MEAFAHLLYTYPLKKKDGRFVQLQHYGFKCPALHEQQMASMTVVAQMVYEWINGGSICRVYELRTEDICLSEDPVKVPREDVYDNYVDMCKKLSKRVCSSQILWGEVKKHCEYTDGGVRTVNGIRKRLVIFPPLSQIKKQFGLTYPCIYFEEKDKTYMN